MRSLSGRVAPGLNKSWPCECRSHSAARRDAAEIAQPKVDWIGIVSPDEYPEADKADCPLDQLDAAALWAPPEY